MISIIYFQNTFFKFSFSKSQKSTKLIHANVALFLFISKRYLQVRGFLLKHPLSDNINYLDLCEIFICSLSVRFAVKIGLL